MCTPTGQDVAAAILRVTGDPGRESFKPSAVRRYLQATNRFNAVGQELSAQIQPHLSRMRESNVIRLHPSYEQVHNRPHEILDRSVIDEMASNSLIDEPLTTEEFSLRDLQHDLQRVEEKIDSISNRLDSLLAGIERMSAYHLVQNDETAPAEQGFRSRCEDMVDNILLIDDVQSFHGDLDFEDRDKFLKLLNFAAEKALYYSVDHKVIGGYSGQPRPYSHTKQVIFGRFGDGGNLLPGTRIFGIPIDSGLDPRISIIIPRNHGASTHNENEVIYGENTFRPVDLNAFLNNPAHFFI